MGKCGYHGGSTIIGPRSKWFTRNGPRPKRKPLTIEALVKSARKSAEAARRGQAATEAEFAAFLSLSSDKWWSIT
jgi:hypothetical protein